MWCHSGSRLQRRLLKSSQAGQANPSESAGKKKGALSSIANDGPCPQQEDGEVSQGNHRGIRLARVN